MLEPRSRSTGLRSNITRFHPSGAFLAHDLAEWGTPANRGPACLFALTTFAILRLEKALHDGAFLNQFTLAHPRWKDGYPPVPIPNFQIVAVKEGLCLSDGSVVVVTFNYAAGKARN
jgi:hypothetical protein